MKSASIGAAALLCTLVVQPAAAAIIALSDPLGAVEAVVRPASVVEPVTDGALTSPVFGAFDLGAANERVQVIASTADTGTSQITTIAFATPLAALAFGLGNLGSSEASGIEIGGSQVGRVAGIDDGAFAGFASDPPVLGVTFQDLTLFTSEVNTRFNIDDFRSFPAGMPVPPAVAFVLTGLLGLTILRPRTA